MSKFTTRVELHLASGEDYQTLHKEMQKEGFLNTVTSDDGITYYLPNAEYNIEGDYTREQVIAKAQTAADRTKKSHSILVTESKGRTWVNLTVVK